MSGFVRDMDVVGSHLGNILKAGDTGEWGRGCVSELESERGSEWEGNE